MGIDVVNDSKDPTRGWEPQNSGNAGSYAVIRLRGNGVTEDSEYAH